MTHEELIGHLKSDARVLQDPRLEEAFRAVDRKFFVPKELQNEAYGDYPFPIGYGATISQPTTVAFMLEKLDVREGQKMLDIGSGSGWTTALLAHLVGASGKVIGLEIVPELILQSRKNIAASKITPHSSSSTSDVDIRLARRGILGLPEEAPFDRILVSAAAQEIPEELIRQLKPDGVMVLPIGNKGEVQKLVRVRKELDGSAETEEYLGFVFVPFQT